MKAPDARGGGACETDNGKENDMRPVTGGVPEIQEEGEVRGRLETPS